MAKSSNAGCGCLGLLGLVFLVGMCSDDDSPSSTASLYDPVPVTSSVPVTTTAAEAEDFYLHGSLNVRTGPGKDYPVSRTLSRGERVRLGPKDAGGWAPVYQGFGTTPQGYLYRASDEVRTYAPSSSSGSEGRSRRASGTTRRASAESRGYYTGPRGGCYTYSASGRKRYVDRSLCN